MKRLILVVSIVMLIGNSAYGSDNGAGTSVAPFLKLGASAKSAGIGGVSVAICEGVDGIWSNPALLANIELREVLFMRHQWLEEVNFNYLAAVLPLKNQGIGASINLISTGDQKRTTYSNPDGNGSFKTGGMVLTAGYGREINNQIQVGVSAKYINQKLDDKTGTGIGVDIGSLYQTQIDGLVVGVVVQNIGISKITFIEKEEKLPLIIKAGAGYRIKNTLMGIDISKPNDNSVQFNLGGQYQITPIIDIRAGYDSSVGITAGFGISHQNLTLDGSYLLTDEVGSTFRLSASKKFR